MSIYATLWSMKLELDQDRYEVVTAQGVPSWIGSGEGYAEGDPYADFLPPAVEPDEEFGKLRAVVFVHDQDHKIGQRYQDPLLILSGEEYEQIRFVDLHQKLIEALRAREPHGS